MEGAYGGVGRTGCRHVSSYNRYWFREGSGESEVENIDWSDGSLKKRISKSGVKLPKNTLRNQITAGAHPKKTAL